MKSFLNFLDEELKPVKGTQYGSNSGGIHVDDEKPEQKYYIKNYENPDQAKVEALTGKIYNHMGIKTLNPEVHGESGVKTKWNDSVASMHEEDFHNLKPHQAHQIGKMYHAAILTKNWDIVGMEHDNIVKHKNGDLHAIDHGGAFHFRAQGGHKDYDAEIHEKHSLRHNEFASGDVFSHTFKHHPDAETHGLEAVKKIDDKHVHKLFKESGLANWRDLHKNFQERKKKLIASYEK